MEDSMFSSIWSENACINHKGGKKKADLVDVLSSALDRSFFVTLYISCLLKWHRSFWAALNYSSGGPAVCSVLVNFHSSDSAGGQSWHPCHASWQVDCQNNKDVINGCFSALIASLPQTEWWPFSKTQAGAAALHIFRSIQTTEYFTPLPISQLHKVQTVFFSGCLCINTWDVPHQERGFLMHLWPSETETVFLSRIFCIMHLGCRTNCFFFFFFGCLI